MRRPEPWFWEARNGWYVQINRKQKLLAKGFENKESAYDVFYKLMAEDGQLPPSKNLTLAELIERFRKWSKDEHTASTQEWYNGHLDSLLDFRSYKKLQAAELKPSHVSAWVSSRKLGQSTRRGAITVVKSLYSFAEKNCSIRNDPIRHMPRPAMLRRSAATTEQRSRITEAVRDEAFASYLLVITESGCRPGEAMKLTADMVQLAEGVIVFSGKTTGVTGHDRIIYMTDRLQSLLAKLMIERPTGSLLLNTDGNPWNRNAVRCRFRRLRAKLNIKGVVAYSLRHAYVTDGLEAGVGIAQMAELAGHSDTKMISEVYSHLQERREHMREQAEKATKKPGG